MPAETEQDGFRIKRSRVDNISITQIIQMSLTTNNRQVHLLFIDLNKVYYTVPIKILRKVLDRVAIHIKAIEAINYTQMRPLEFNLANLYQNNLLFLNAYGTDALYHPL